MFELRTLGSRTGGLMCEPGWFPCQSEDVCVERRFICDDHYDCLDHSDEWNCSKCGEKDEDEDEEGGGVHHRRGIMFFSSSVCSR